MMTLYKEEKVCDQRVSCLKVSAVMTQSSFMLIGVFHLQVVKFYVGCCCHKKILWIKKCKKKKQGNETQNKRNKQKFVMQSGMSLSSEHSHNTCES